jgi:dTDP-4-dehydrorhamnose reductase
LKILLTGKNGQVGYELERSLQGLGEIIALDREQMNLADLIQVRDVIRTIKPDLIVNAAAYTSVDKAESEPELAMRINGEAPAVMAEEARKLGAVMIHFSTDYVFDGTKTAPYTEDDIAHPLNIYGASKLAGERAIAANGIPYLILRTSWIYGMRGKNFLRTVMQHAKEKSELHVVNDQYGAPTWSRTVAETTAHIIAQSATSKTINWWQEKTGIYHLAARGQTTWYGFAKAILDNSLDYRNLSVLPIALEDYPLLATRPRNSVMSCERFTRTFCELPEWQDGLRLCQT